MNEEQLHDFRKRIDISIHRAENMIINAESNKEEMPYAHEMGIACTKLQEAKMWVGKCLEKLGSDLPKEFSDKAEEFEK